MSYREELKFVEEADSSLFPDWLFRPIFNDFGDNYYEKSFANTRLITEIKRLKRRYNDFFEWIEACEIYKEYMQTMIEKYGSKRTIKNALELDMLDDPIPAKPKLKNNRTNRQFLRAGVIPSQRIIDVPIDKDEILAIARQAFPEATGENVDESDNFKKYPKSAMKRIRRIQEQMEGQNRKMNLYRSTGNNHGTDFIVEYLNQAKRGKYGIQKEDLSDTLSLSERVEEYRRIQETPPEILEHELSEKESTITSYGRLVNRKEQERMDLFEALYKEGYDIFGKFGKTMDKQSVKMIRRRVGATEPATKKEMKKLKKKQKRDQRQIEKRRDASDLLERTLLNNKLNLDRDDSGNLSLRLKDLYRD